MNIDLTYDKQGMDK